MRIWETQIQKQHKTPNKNRRHKTEDRCVCVCVTAAHVTSQAWDRLCGLGMIFIVTTPLVSFCMEHTRHSFYSYSALQTVTIKESR